MALKDFCSYILDEKFDEPFRDIEIENTNDPSIYDVEASTAQKLNWIQKRSRKVKG